MLSYFDTEEQTPDQARLYETCLKGSRDEIRNYCKNEDITSQYIKDGMNPMHVVAIAGRKDAEVILDVMLQNGFDVNDQTMSGEDTVLHLIVEHIDVKEAFPLVLKILEYDPDIHLRNRRLRTAYDIAIARGEFELAEVLDGHMTAAEAREYYKSRIAAIYGRKERVMSPRTKRYLQAKLIDAVLRSNETDIQDFLKLGADPNYVNEHKNGAIHYAITHCTLPTQRTLQLLIDGNADVDLQDDEGDTALNLVIKMTKLKDSGEMYNCAELLVQNGALSTYKDLDGNDALMLAKKKQYTDIVKLLTERRPQHVQLPPPLVDDEDERPPPIFNEDERLPPVPELPNEEQQQESPEPRTRRQPMLPPPVPRTDQNTEPSPRPPQIRPPVRPPIPPVPRFVPQPDIDEMSEDEGDVPPPMNPQRILYDDDLVPRGPRLRPFGSPVDTEEEMFSMEDSEHLIKALREGTLEEVNAALFGLRADPNLPGDDGIYPIHHVLIRGEMDEEERIEMLKSLIEAGADVNQKTVNSESTPLHVAATRNQDEAAKVLLGTHKCDYNLKNKHDKTPYDVAEEEECQEVMDAIEEHRRRVRQRMQRAAKASTCTIL